MRAVRCGALLGAAAAAAAACPDADPGLTPVQLPPSGGDLSISPGARVLWAGPGEVRLRSLTVGPGAELVFARRANVTIAVRWVAVSGSLVAGTAECPFTGRLNVRLLGSPGEAGGTALPPLPGLVSKVLAVLPGGRLEIHGEQGRASWLRLAATAARGSTTLWVDRADHGWRPGDRVAIGPSGFNASDTEDAQIAAVSGARLELTSPLQAQKYGGAPQQRRELNTEVALLSRNVVVEGDMSGLPYCPEIEDGGATPPRPPYPPPYPPRSVNWSGCFGGHSVFLSNTSVRIAGAELRRMGQANVVARYPIHWHIPGPSYGSYVRDSAVHDCFQRCVALHGAFGVEVEGVACVRTKGHAFYLEDAIEYDNVLRGNLAMAVRQGPLLCSDNALGVELGFTLPPGARPDRGPSGYWITNPNNTLEGNVAAGIGGRQHGFGFWLALPAATFDPSQRYLEKRAADLGVPQWALRQRPDHTPLLHFRRNVAKACYHGIQVDGAPGASQPAINSRQAGTTCAAQGTAQNRGRVTVQEAVLAKNRRGLWLNAMNFTVNASLFADNGGGMLLEDLDYFDGSKAVTGCAFVGETDNQYSPKERVACMHFPQPDPVPHCQGYPIRGIDAYDGPLCVYGARYGNFSSDGTRNASFLNTFDIPEDYVNPLLLWPLRPLDSGSEAVRLSDTALYPSGELANVSQMVGAESVAIYWMGNDSAKEQPVSTVADTGVLADAARCGPPGSGGFRGRRCTGQRYLRFFVAPLVNNTPAAPDGLWRWWRVGDPQRVTEFRQPITNFNTPAGSCLQGHSDALTNASRGTQLTISFNLFWAQPGDVLRAALWIGPGSSISDCQGCSGTTEPWSGAASAPPISAAMSIEGWLLVRLGVAPGAAAGRSQWARIEVRKGTGGQPPPYAPLPCPPLQLPPPIPDGWWQQWCAPPPPDAGNPFVD